MSKMNQAALLILSFPLASFALAQDVPAAKSLAPYTGFSLPDVSGTLRYSLTVSQRIALTSDGTYGLTDATNFSGNIAYLSNSVQHPFSAVYSLAYLQNDSSHDAQFISNLSLSQVLSARQWTFVMADTVTFLPETSTGGLSGVAGLGDLNVPSVSETGQEILTGEVKRLTNRASATVERSLTPRTSISATGSQYLIRYLDEPYGSTTDEDAYSASASFHHTFDPRTSAGLSYSYTALTFLASSYGITTQSVYLQFSRTVNRKFVVSGSVGPQRTTSSEPALVPPRTSVSGSANLTYVSRALNTNLIFSRTTLGGSGLVAGIESTTATFNLGHQFGRTVHAAAHVGYLSAASLQTGAFSANSVVFGGQLNRSIARKLSAFVSYSAERQVTQGSNIPTLAARGIGQNLGFGVTYAPGSLHLGH